VPIRTILYVLCMTDAYHGQDEPSILRQIEPDCSAKLVHTHDPLVTKGMWLTGALVHMAVKFDYLHAWFPHTKSLLIDYFGKKKQTP
jgi:hypothetical protein